jgi:SAM-dependent methyltransferase
MKLFSSLISAFLSIIFASLSAQEVQVGKTYEPHAGQEGKDVIWVPSPKTQVESMLDLAKVTANDFVIDLGSGDGRTVIAAAKRGAKARGIEFDQNMVELSRKNADKEEVSDKVEFIQGDLFEADLSQASVITMFLLPEINLKLRPSLLELKPGTRIVSNTFQMDEWIPDSTVRAEDDCQFWCDAYLWIIPAKVGGIWKMLEAEITINQKFQTFSGIYISGERKKRISEGKINGNQICFNVNKDKYSGIINGSFMEGTVKSGTKTRQWNAERSGE